MKDNIEKRKAALGAGFITFATAMALLALSLLFAGAPTAAADTGSGEKAAPAAQASATPRPIKLRPWLQFGHARPGETVTYHKVLMNRLNAQTGVTFDAGSLLGWNISVDPTSSIILPGYANVVTATVQVPMRPAEWADIERVRANITSPEVYTSTAYMITLTWRRPFVDLQPGDWADDPVQFLVSQGILSGYEDGTFRPNNDVTRAQFAKMLVGAMGWSIQTPPTPTFGDVPTDFWAYGYIETAVAHGAISGYEDGTFRPNNDVTRAQAAKMLYISRGWTMQSPDYTNYSDVSQSDWFYTYAEAASSAEVMTGYQDNTFRPNAPATRAQIAKILAYAMYSDPNQ